MAYSGVLFCKSAGAENYKSPRRISGGGMRISSFFLKNERRAEGFKDLPKQQGFKFVLNYFLLF